MTEQQQMSPEDRSAAIAWLAGDLSNAEFLGVEAERIAQAEAFLPFVAWLDEPMADPRGAGRPPLSHRVLRPIDENGDVRRLHDRVMNTRSAIVEHLNRAAARHHGKQLAV